MALPGDRAASERSAFLRSAVLTLLPFDRVEGEAGEGLHAFETVIEMGVGPLADLGTQAGPPLRILRQLYSQFDVVSRIAGHRRIRHAHQSISRRRMTRAQEAAAASLADPVPPAALPCSMPPPRQAHPHSVQYPSISFSAMTIGPLALTEENIERIFDELRPYLEAEGGTIQLVGIDGSIVTVRLLGITDSGSTMTLMMGIERQLREVIPEVSKVVQVRDY